MKQIMVMLLCGWTSAMSAQLTWEDCQQKAQENYPLVRQYALIDKAASYTVAGLNKGNLPQVSLSGKASYQSDVTSLPFDLPGVPDELLPHDQYQAVVEVQQHLWDGGNIRAQKREALARAEEQRGQLSVNMYALRSRVNQLFFGILLLEEQLKLNTLLQEHLERSYQRVAAFCENGVANTADLDAVRAEQLRTRQQAITMEGQRDAYRRMLSRFTGLDIDTTRLLKPVPDVAPSSAIRRPELDWYAAQERRITVEEQSLKAAYMPRLSLFAQGGYANPALNILHDGFEPYYIVGARLSWTFGSLYRLKDDRRRLDAERLAVRSRADAFLFDTHLQLTEQDATITSLRRQMTVDEELIELRQNIRRAAEAKAENGTMSVLDMLQEINRESQARQDKAVHEVQLLLDIYERKCLTN